MKKIILVLTTCLLTGCVSSGINEVMNNKFIDVNSEAAPAELVGYWTGAIGPALNTIYIQPDGNGQMCSSFGRDAINRIKYSKSAIHTDSGSRFELKKLTQNSMTLYYPHGFGQEYQYKRDQLLSEAPLYCVTVFKK